MDENPNPTVGSQPEGAAPESQLAEPSVNAGELGVGALPQEYNWDDDRNPYKYAALQLQQESAERERQYFASQAQARVQELEKQGLTPEQAQGILQNEWQGYQLQQHQERLNQQARPVVAHVLAQQISEKYGIQIKPQELLASSSGAPINSVDSMLARADALVAERRRAITNTRQKDGADKLDMGGGGTQTTDPARYRKMTPSQIISEGLRKMK